MYQELILNITMLTMKDILLVHLHKLNLSIDLISHKMQLHGTIIIISNHGLMIMIDWMLRVTKLTISQTQLKVLVKLIKTKNKNLDQLKELHHGTHNGLIIINHITPMQIEVIQIGKEPREKIKTSHMETHNQKDLITKLNYSL